MRRGDTITLALLTAADGACQCGRTVTHGGCTEPGLCGRGGISWAQLVNHESRSQQRTVGTRPDLGSFRPQSCAQTVLSFHPVNVVTVYGEVKMKNRLPLRSAAPGPPCRCLVLGAAGTPRCDPATAL